MMETTPAPSGLTRTALDVLAACGESPELAAFRRRAWDVYESLPWPTTEDEGWRRTDLSLVAPEAHAPVPAVAVPAEGIPGEFSGQWGEGEELLLWGSAGPYRRVSKALEDRGVLFLDLAEAVRRAPRLVWPRLGRILAPERGKFSALSAALWGRGLFVYVPKNVDAGAILRGGYAPSLEPGQALFSRTLVVAEAGSRLTLLVDHGARGDRALSVEGAEFYLGDNADVTYVNLQRLGAGVDHFFSQDAQVASGGKLTALALAIGGRISRADFGSQLAGPGASAGIYGLVFGEGEQRLTHHTRQSHEAPHTASDCLFKAALMGRARSIYTGLIRIEKTAVQANAYQASKNILLSKEARANAIPMLEILTDDVKCGHGAAVGSLDEDQRFYLMSRGLDRREAERAIVEGFFEDVLARVPVSGARDALRSAIDAKLGENA
jgi:Fe-S cluster assembly protein SufD